MKTLTKSLSCLLLTSLCLSPHAQMQIIGGSQSQQQFFNLSQQKIYVDVDSQKLYLTSNYNTVIASYKISTGRTGTGERSGSYKTPRGLHIIQSKIGDNQDPMSKYKSRVKVGTYDPAHSRYDNILSRILTLEGKQQHNKNTRQRCVYIHGTSATNRLGKKPCSLGCIRMCPHEIIDLYGRINTGTAVYIHDKNNCLPWESKATVHVNKNTIFSARRENISVSYAS